MNFERTKSSGYMTNWAARLFARAIDRELKGSGISSGYMPIIFALANGAALSQKKLAEHASIEQPTMAATLSRMERDGLLARRPNPDDGRSALFFLTPDGMGKTAAVRAAGHAVNARAMRDLSEDERVLYLDMLNRIAASLADDG
jgi:MarR family transcriptional regulator for hemolysin